MADEHASPIPTDSPTERTLLIAYWDDSGRGDTNAAAWIITHGCPGSAVQDRLEDAIADYLATAVGRAAARCNHGDFNWGDAFSDIPDEVWARDAIVAVEWVGHTPGNKIVVEHDTNFAYDLDLHNEDEDDGDGALEHSRS